MDNMINSPVVNEGS